MAYEKQNWENFPSTETPITAERLNHMEDGIEEAWNHGGGGGAGETLPIGSEIDFDGNVSDIPDGWEQVDDVPVYSTTETVCGTWIDGKPIYRRVLQYTYTSTGSHSESLSSLNIDTITLYNWNCLTNNIYIINAYDFQDSSAKCNLWFDKNTNKVYMVNGTAWTSAKFTLILEYTKTTD